MRTKVSTKGQVVLPSPLRRRLDVRAGDSLDIEIHAGRIVLTPRKKRRYKAKIIADPVTGLPVLTVGPDAPPLTSREVAGILTNFP
jgi:AbrB family looped-hinge helix DNA binding protein